MSRSLLILGAVAALALTGTGVLADDFAPPWWRHKDPDPQVNRSTWQQWEFGSSEDGNILPLAPDNYVNPPFDPNNPTNPTLGAAVSHMPGHDWLAEHEGRPGVWPLSDGGAIVLQIPNYLDGTEKKAWIQLTWTPRDPGDTPPASTRLPSPGNSLSPANWSSFITATPAACGSSRSPYCCFTPTPNSKRSR